MKRSNTANIDPRNINFADVKRRLENKIDTINSYQSKRGTYRDVNSNSPAFSSSKSSYSNNPGSGSFADRQQNTPYNNPSASQNNGYGSQFGYQPMNVGQPTNYATPNSFQSPIARNIPVQEASMQQPKDVPVVNNYVSNNAPLSTVTPALDNGSLPTNYDIHKKLDFLEQERLSDLKLRAEDSKFSSLAKNLERVEEKIESLNSPEFANNLVSQMDSSLELIQRKLDKLEQDRIDALRLKIDQERADELERSIGKLESKVEGAYVAKVSSIQGQHSSDVLNLLQRKIERLEEDRIESLKSKAERDRTAEIERNLQKIESKISATTDMSPVANFTHLDALSKEELLRKLERLEQDRINDLKDIMDQENIMLLNKKIEDLETKVDKTMAQTPSVSSLVVSDSASGIAKKLEKLEQSKLEDLKAQREEEKLLALSRSLSSIEAKLESVSQAPVIHQPSAVEKMLETIAARLERLEDNKGINSRYSAENSFLEKIVEKLDSKIERIAPPVEALSPLDTKYIAILDTIQKKLERLEQDKLEEIRGRAEYSRLNSLERSLERIEDSLCSQRFPYSAVAERDGLGKKLDRLEKDYNGSLCSSHNKNNAFPFQDNIDKLENKLEFMGKRSFDDKQNVLSPILVSLVNRLEEIERKRLDDKNSKKKLNYDSSLTKVLEDVESSLDSMSAIQSEPLSKNYKIDSIIEKIQRKIQSLEDYKSQGSYYSKKDNKYESINNYLEKINSKIANNLRKLDTLPINKRSKSLIEDIQNKLSNLENSTVENNSIEDKVEALPHNLERITSKKEYYENYDEESKIELIQKKLDILSDNKTLEKVKLLKEALQELSVSDEFASELGNVDIHPLIEKNDTIKSSFSNGNQPYSNLSYESDYTKGENCSFSEISSTKDNLNTKDLSEIKEKLDSLSNIISNCDHNSNFSIDEILDKVYRKFSQLEESKIQDIIDRINENIDSSTYHNNSFTKHLFDKNNEVLINISNHLRNLTFEFKNLYDTGVQIHEDIPFQKFINAMTSLQDQYIDSLKTIEYFLEKSYKNDEELKKYLLEYNSKSSEISQVKSDLYKKRESAQTSLLLSEIHKIKKYIDNNSLNGFSPEMSSILNEIKEQQQFIKKSLDSSKVLFSGDSSIDYLLMEDIKNLLTEVNYRNKVLNDTVDNSHSKLSIVINKVDSFLSSLYKIDDISKIISRNDAHNAKYIEALDESFAKLKEDNSRIIKVLHDNSLQSNLLSEQSGLLIKSLREDILNISKLERISIVSEFSSLESKIVEFKDFIANQDIKEEGVISSLGKLVEGLDNIANLQEETINYFKSLDANIEEKLNDLDTNQGKVSNTITSEIKLYLEDSKDKAKYFDQIKNKIDENSLNMKELLSSDVYKVNQHDTLVNVTSGFKNVLDGLSKTVESLLDNHNKTTTSLNILIDKTDEILESESTKNLENSENNKLLKTKLEDIDNIQNQTLLTSKFIDAKTNDMQSVIAKIKTDIDSDIIEKVDLLNTNIEKSKEEVSVLIKDVSTISSNKLEGLQKDLELASCNINELSLKSNDIITKVDKVKQDISEKIEDSNGKIVKDIDVTSGESATKLMELQEKLASISVGMQTLSSKTDDIKLDIKESKDSLNRVSESIEDIVLSMGSIDFDNVINNIANKVSLLEEQHEDIEDLTLGFQNEIKSKLLPYVSDKSFADNFNKFTNYSSKQIQNLKKSIQSFNTDLDLYLFEDKIMTNDNLVNLLTNFKQITDLQDIFFKTYSINSDRLIDFAKKTKSTVAEIDVAKAENIYSTIQEVISNVSLESKKYDVKNILIQNNAKNTKKVDLLANMDYLNKEITKKTDK